MGEHSRRRAWPLRYAAELVVLVLLAAALAAYVLDPGESPADPRGGPVALAPPAGLKLPRATAVPAVAGQSPEVAVDPARVAATVRPLLRKRLLGRHFAVLVTDLSTGRTVFRTGAAMVTPASTAKLLTSVAALETLGPMARFRTSVRWVAATRTLVLVGGGDPFLTSTPRLAASSYPRRADVTTLARAAAARLRGTDVGRVRLAYDDSAFTGPAVNPAWPDTYVSEGVVPPISALWVNEGHAPGGEGYVADPAAQAGKVFADALRSTGVKVAQRVVRMRAPATSVVLASVSSAPVGEIVERTLAVSDNNAAEVLARHVGIAERQQGSSAAGAAAVLSVVRRLGVRVAGDVLRDGSGLSRQDLLAPATLAGVVRLAADRRRPELRQVLTGLPVAGFTGSLAARFDTGPVAARGRVRAKTGTLTGVHGLAGIADDVSGARMAFVVVADRVDPTEGTDAQTLIDRIAGALGACTCGVGS